MSTHIQNGDTAGGDLSGTYPNPTVSSSIPKLLITVSSINAKTVATTSIYTVPAGKTAILLSAVVRCTAATAITNGPTASIGTNSTSFNNIYASTNIAALTSTTSAFGFSSVGMFGQAIATSTITLNITTGSTGTSQTIAVDIFGYTV